MEISYLKKKYESIRSIAQSTIVQLKKTHMSNA